jgi:ATP-binding cassette subfamily F protein uup
MTVDQADASGRMVFELDHVSKSYDGRPVIRDVTTRIMRGDRVGLIGPNGSGKTTLLRLLVGELPPDSGEVRHGARLEVAYFDQQRAQLDPERTLVESVADGETVTSNGQERHVAGYLADFLFPRERMRSPVKSLSGGERNRLLLARLFARPANVLVLDEPTNDLDIETLELLEELIDRFDGTVLIVTHDRAFLDNVVTSTFAFEGDGRVQEYVGGWEDYRRAALRIRQQADTTSSRSSRSDSTVRDGGEQERRRQAERIERKKRTFNESREHAGLPSQIEALEAEQQQLESEVASPEFYKSPAERIHTVLARIETIRGELERALARWVELEDIGG